MKRMTTTRTKEKASKMVKDIMTITKVCLAVTCGLPGLLHEEDNECLKTEERSLKKK